MIWGNAWALLGLVGIALPVLIHLLGRGHARVLRFPTLRFLDASRLLPTKRSRIQDPLLLAVRIAIVGLAALALAQPLLLTRGRRDALDRGLARAVIVDTSASAARAVADSVDAVARRLAAGAQTSRVIRSARPAAAIAGAAAWVAGQRRRGEIAIVSDFQRGEIDREDLATIPSAIGVVLRRVPLAANVEPLAAGVLVAGQVRRASSRPAPDGIEIDWRDTPDSSPRVPLELLGARDDGSAIDALASAVATLPLRLPIDTTRAIAVVFPRYPARDSLIRALTPARSAWKLALVAGLRDAGVAVAAVGDGVVNGARRFVVATDANPASLDAARIVNAARRAASAAPDAKELDPTVVSDADLAAWQRAPDASTAPRAHSNEEGPSDARWLWSAVLALLLVEWWIRRMQPAPRAVAAERARAA
jgi:hypothetical protein